MSGPRHRTAVTRLCATIVVMAAGVGVPAGAADTWPVKPLRFIVPQAPGAQNDVQARLIAPRLAERLRQPVVVDNRPGAGGALGFESRHRRPTTATRWCSARSAPLPSFP